MRVDEYAEVTYPPAGFELIGNDVTDTSGGTQPNGTLKRIIPQNFMQSASPDFARLTVCAHSYGAGYGTLEGGERFSSRLAASLGAEEVSYVTSGAVLAIDSASGNPGGYANVLNGLAPRVSTGSSYVPRNSSPYLSLSPLNVFYYGFNDLVHLTATTATNVAWFTMAQRACICIARAGGYFPDTDSSVAYGGTGGSHWSANSNVQQYGSPTNHQTATLADKVTITVPADFPGGEIDLLTLAYGGGAKWSTVVDGGSAQILDGTGTVFGSASGRANMVVQRLTGLAAGAHTVVMTLVALDSGASAFFDSWLIASTQAPLTVLCTAPTLPSMPFASGGVHDPVTLSDLNALNAAINAVAAEFTDGMVVVADVAAYFLALGGNVAYTSPKSLYASDGLHPNANGHGVIAQCIRDAIRLAPSPKVARMTAMSVVMRQITGPLENGLASPWSIFGAFGTGYAWYGKDQAGNTLLQLKIARTGSPSVNEVITYLPKGYQPAVQTLCPGVSWSSGWTSVAPAFVAVLPDGAIRWFAGDPTIELDVTFSWPSNGLSA